MPKAKKVTSVKKSKKTKVVKNVTDNTPVEDTAEKGSMIQIRNEF